MMEDKQSLPKLKFPTARKEKRKLQLEEFASTLMKIQDIIVEKYGSRGWCYILEVQRLINKDEFDKLEKLINDLRKQGYLPINFTAQDTARDFLHRLPDEEDVGDYICGWVDHAETGIIEEYAHDFLMGQDYYLIVMVEKIDLKILFRNICKELQIPIANCRGWSDINSRAELIKHIKKAKDRGQTPVLLYCGDYDPSGLEISNTIKKNLNDLEKATGYNADDLIIDRFGLNKEFIIENKLTWIDNLITGTGGRIAEEIDGEIVQGRTKKGRPHPDFNKTSTQAYLKENGVRKVEANALVVAPKKAAELLMNTIHKYIPQDEIKTYLKQRKQKREEIKSILDKNKDLFNKLRDGIKGAQE